MRGKEKGDRGKYRAFGTTYRSPQAFCDVMMKSGPVLCRQVSQCNNDRHGV